MKNATACAKQLKAVLKKAKAGAPEVLDPIENPVGVLVMSFLQWESTVERAESAYQRLLASVVDFNDLRVTMPHEMASIAESEDEHARERFERLRACLRDIFMREHEVTLESLQSAGKREAKKYIESLDGVVPYVAARVLLLAFQTHGIPVDEQLRQSLIDAGAADEDSDAAEISSWLSRQIKADEGIEAHHALQAWAEVEGEARRKKAARRSKRKTTTKKAPAKKSTAKKTTTTKKSTAKTSTTKKSPAKKSSKKKSTTKKTTSKTAAKKTTRKSTTKKSTTRTTKKSAAKKTTRKK